MGTKRKNNPTATKPTKALRNAAQHQKNSLNTSEIEKDAHQSLQAQNAHFDRHHT